MTDDRWRIPTLTMSGGEADPEDCLRFRVWVNGRGDAFFYETVTLEVARLAAEVIAGEDHGRVVDLVGIVWDNEYHSFREVLVRGQEDLK